MVDHRAVGRDKGDRSGTRVTVIEQNFVAKSSFFSKEHRYPDSVVGLVPWKSLVVLNDLSTSYKCRSSDESNGDTLWRSDLDTSMIFYSGLWVDTVHFHQSMKLHVRAAYIGKNRIEVIQIRCRI